jgi:branched-chain amino acid transport system permease protein
MHNIADTIVQGILLGGLYGLFAAGLSLVFGVMRMVNVAHGDLLVLAAFLSLVLQKMLGSSSAFITLIVLLPLMFALGYGLQQVLLNPVVGHEALRPVLVTFGLSVIIQNALLQVFSADSQRLQGGRLESSSLALPGGLTVGALPLAIFATCTAVIAALGWMLYHTKLGRALRATADDPATAGLVGIDDRHVFAVATGIALAVVAIAAVFMGIRSSFDPSAGPQRLVFAFEAVIIGGLGSLWGTLLGGVVLGISQSLGARFSPEWQILAGHICFLVVLMLRPQGLYPRHGD